MFTHLTLFHQLDLICVKVRSMKSSFPWLLAWGIPAPWCGHHRVWNGALRGSFVSFTNMWTLWYLKFSVPSVCLYVFNNLIQIFVEWSEANVVYGFGNWSPRHTEKTGFISPIGLNLLWNNWLLSVPGIFKSFPLLFSPTGSLHLVFCTASIAYSPTPMNSTLSSL